MPSLSPITKLTKPQLKALLERALLREPSGAVSGINPELIQPSMKELMPAPEGSFKVPVGGTPPDSLWESPSVRQQVVDSYRGLNPFEGAGSTSPLEKLGGSAFKNPEQGISNFVNAGETTLPGQTLPLDLRSYARSNPSTAPWPFPPAGRTGAEIDLNPGLHASGGISVLDRLMQQGLSPRELALSRFLKMGKAGEPVPVDIPHEEAKRLVLEGPEAISKAGYLQPSAQQPSGHVTRVRPAAQDETDAVHGLALERLKWKSPLTQAEKKNMSVAEGALKETTPAGEKPKAEEALSMGTQMAQLWQKIGGKRGTMGQLWGQALNASPLKSMFTNPREYMIHSGVKWQKNPTEFERKHPRESKYLKMHWKEYMESGK